MKKHSLEVYEGYIITGPEYVTLFDCATGDELDTTDYYFGREDDGMLWGDYAMNYSAGGDYLNGGTGTTWAKYGHGDAIRITDIDPDNPGLEIASCFEGGAWAPYNWAVRDAETNTVLFGAPGTTDYGRLIIGDVLPGVRECRKCRNNSCGDFGNRE